VYTDLGIGVAMISDESFGQQIVTYPYATLNGIWEEPFVGDSGGGHFIVTEDAQVQFVGVSQAIDRKSISGEERIWLSFSTYLPNL
jgi:hypothetical protein